MPNDQPNSDEGADPSTDIKQQNPGGRTTTDLTSGHDDPARAGAGEGPDAGADGHAHENEGSQESKTEDLAKAGRTNMDTDAGQE